MKGIEISTSGKLDRLNYTKLMSYNPTEYDTVDNHGETFSLVEHPTKGDEYPVIIIHHATKQAACSNFWETDDLMGSYKPVLVDGKIEEELG